MGFGIMSQHTFIYLLHFILHLQASFSKSFKTFIHVLEVTVLTGHKGRIP